MARPRRHAPEDQPVTFSITLDPWLLQRLVYAGRAGESRNATIDRCVRRGVDLADFEAFPGEHGFLVARREQGLEMTLKARTPEEAADLDAISKWWCERRNARKGRVTA